MEGNNEPEMSSDDEFLQPFKQKSRKRTKRRCTVISDSSDSDSDFDPDSGGRKRVRPLHEESDEERNVQFYLDSGNESSGDSDVDKCAICLGKLSGQDIATPETCDHTFCFACLREWCKNVNTCPIDRLKFHLMLVRRPNEERIYGRVCFPSGEGEACPKRKVSVDSSLDPPFILDSNPELSVTSNASLRCSFCRGQSDSEPFIPCPDCDKLFHPSCLMQPFFSGLGIQQFCPSCYFSSRTPTAFQYNSRRTSIIDREVAHVKRERVPSSFAFARKQRRWNLMSSRASIPVGSEASHLSHVYDDLDDNLDSGINADRYSYSDSMQHSSSVSNSRTLPGSFRSEIVRTNNPENFDLVGSILESQKVLSCLDILERCQDGSFVVGSGSQQSVGKSLPSARNIQACKNLLCGIDSLVSSRPSIPHSNSEAEKQRPLNPTQNSNSNYHQAPQSTYTCTSSTSKESFREYESLSFATRTTFESAGSERYNNESTSSAVCRGYCDASGSLKNCKELSKMPASEDEVDIYSDIESVGTEEGEIRSVSGGDDIMNSTFQEDSPTSNPEPNTDSSDNELVIDEDMAGGDEENRKESTAPLKEANIDSHVENVAHSMLDESSDNDSSNVECERLKTEKLEMPHETSNESFPHANSPVFSPVKQSSQGVLQERSFPDSNSAVFSQAESSPGASPEVINSDSIELSPEHDEITTESQQNETESMKPGDGHTDDEESSLGVSQKTMNSHSIELSPELDERTIQTQLHETESVKPGGVHLEDEDSVNGDLTDVENEKTDVNFEALDEASIEESPKHISDFISSSDHCKKSFVVTKNSNHCLEMSPASVNSCKSPKMDDENLERKSLVGHMDAVHNSLVEEHNLILSESKVCDGFLSPKHEFENICSQALGNDNSSSNIDAQSEHKETDPINETSQVLPEEEKDLAKSDEIYDIDDPCTPCQDENIDDYFGNSSPLDDACEASGMDCKMEVTSSDIAHLETPQFKNESSSPFVALPKPGEKVENDDDLGIEDISEAGSGDIDDDFPDEVSMFSESNPDYGENSASKYEYGKKPSEKYSFVDDQEEGEIIEEKPYHRPGCKQSVQTTHYLDDRGDLSDSSSRRNISELPRIPKIKRDREKVPVNPPVENRRTSVLGKVDLGSVDIGWKRLSKNTRERSYRDGKPKEERVLYRERESRKKEKASCEHERKSDSKSSGRRDREKSDSERSRNERDPHSRKSDKKDRVSDRDASRKSHSEKQLEKRKDRRESHDKTKHSRTEKKNGQDKNHKRRDSDRHDREPKLEKSKKSDRSVHEKGKCKDHKSKHKDKKNEIIVEKDSVRDKHKLSHVLDHLAEKQRDVRSFDRNLKIVVEQKEERTDKTKLKVRKEIKQIQVEKKPEIGRIPYSELTSIESKEIFTKGDSIIINVSFNRTNPSKSSKVEPSDSKDLDRKSEECEIIAVKPAKEKLKDRKEKTATSAIKKPSTPPEKLNPVLSVSEGYWQGGDDPDASSDSKSIEVIGEDEIERFEPAEVSSTSSSSLSSSDDSEPEEKHEENTCEEKLCDKADSSLSKAGDVSSPIKRKSPRSPSPPSPADNDSYDPCEPTRSPSPPPVPPPPLPAGNPNPPPELPPLPPEPEPADINQEQQVHPPTTSFGAASSVSSGSQTVATNQAPAVNSIPAVQTSNSAPIHPPSYLPRTSMSGSSLSPVIPPSSFAYQMANPGNVLFQPSPVLRGIVPHPGSATIPPPPNPPLLPNMPSVPPPPPPPSGMTLLHHHTLPQLNVHPTITANAILQSLTMRHAVSLQMPHMPHPMVTGFSNPVGSHQSSLVMASQNQPLSLPVAMSNPASRVLMSQNPLANRSMAQNLVSPASSQQPLIVLQGFDKTAPESSNEVVDMEVDSPYSPGDLSNDESVCDYSPTCSPPPSGSSPPKTQDVFDLLLPVDHRTPEKRTVDAVGRTEKSKHSEPKTDYKRAKHEHKKHSIRMQMDHKGGRHRSREPKPEKKLDDTQLKILDELPSSAVEMQVKEKFLKKLNRQERVVEEVKLALKPYYKSRDVNKEEYKDILRRSVPKICHNKSGEINPVKVKALVDCYIRKIKHARKKKHS